MVMKTLNTEKLLVPIYGIAYFVINKRQTIQEILEFDYLDEKKFYSEILHKPQEYKREILMLWENMQEFLDKEKIAINGKETHGKVNHVEILHRGVEEIATVLYLITIPEFTPSEGSCLIESWSEEERAEYDLDAYWIFPKGTEFLEIFSPMDYDIYDNTLVLWARKGDRVGGYEKIKVRY